MSLCLWTLFIFYLSEFGLSELYRYLSIVPHYVDRQEIFHLTQFGYRNSLYCNATALPERTFKGGCRFIYKPDLCETHTVLVIPR